MSRLSRLQQISDCSNPIRMIGVSYAYRRHFVICKPFVCFQQNACSCQLARRTFAFANQSQQLFAFLVRQIYPLLDLHVSLPL